MYLIDSNIIIYSFYNQYEYLKPIIYNDLGCASEITRVEVLGYHKLDLEERIYYEKLFKVVPIIYPTPEIFNKAIEIRQRWKISLGDSIIAATALLNNCLVYTRNIKDFEKIEDLKFIDPVK